MKVTNHDGQPYSTVREDFVEPVLFTGEHAERLLTGNQAQIPQVLGRNEAATEQPTAGQHSQPTAVGPIRLAAGNLFDMAGIDNRGDDSLTLQSRGDAMPVLSITTIPGLAALAHWAKARRSGLKVTVFV